jgi:hypothetical protein
MQEVMGSDHCPVGIDLYDVHPDTGESLASLLIKVDTPHPLSTFHWNS